MRKANTAFCSIKQEIEKIKLVAKRSSRVSELEETKRHAERLVEELRYSEDKEVKPLYDDLQDILMELTIKIETLTSCCKPRSRNEKEAI